MHTKLLWKMSKIYLWELFSRLPYPKSIIKMFSILCLKVHYILCDIDYIISFQEYWVYFWNWGKNMSANFEINFDVMVLTLQFFHHLIRFTFDFYSCDFEMNTTKIYFSKLYKNWYSGLFCAFYLKS